MTLRMIAALLLSTFVTGVQAEPRFGLADPDLLDSIDLPVVGAVSTGQTTNRQINVLDNAHRDETSGEAVVDLGSITKFVTAVTVLHLIDAGHFTADTSLGELLPGVPKDKAQITVHQLLTHTSGLIESTGDDAEPLTRDAFLDRVMAAPLVHAPGGPYLYSNAGYSVLAAIAERTSGKPYEAYLIDDILTPLGLEPIGYAAAYAEDRSLLSSRSFGTGFARSPIRAASWGDYAPGWNLIGNGGAVTTVEGFVDFWNAFLDGRIVSPALVARALAPHADEGSGTSFYGYGLVVERSPAHGLMYWHDGGNDIFSAEWRHFADHGTTVVLAGTGEDAFLAMEQLMGDH